MTDYETGYRARVAGNTESAVEAHFDGSAPLDMSDDWFNGYQDATDDLEWRAQGVEQMQFGL